MRQCTVQRYDCSEDRVCGFWQLRRLFICGNTISCQEQQQTFPFAISPPPHTLDTPRQKAHPSRLDKHMCLRTLSGPSRAGVYLPTKWGPKTRRAQTSTQTVQCNGMPQFSTHSITNENLSSFPNLFFDFTLFCVSKNKMKWVPCNVVKWACFLLNGCAFSGHFCPVRKSKMKWFRHVKGL